MATKKARPAKSLPTTREIVEHLSSQDEILEKLEKRFEHAHVLNGGFDNLMQKVEKIGSTQMEMNASVTTLQVSSTKQGQKLDEVHTAIFDPEKGLYSKVKGALKWIGTANWVIKGVVGVLGAGLLTGMGKLLYDVFTGHIHYTP